MAYTVGDEAYASFGRYDRVDVRKGAVTRVTPSGQVVVAFESGPTERFTHQGWRIGSDKWDRAHLIDANDYQRLFLKMQEQRVRSSINATLRKLSGDQPKDELLAALRDIAAMAEKLP